MKQMIALVMMNIFLLAACSRSSEPLLLGTLERERVAVTAEAAERILRIEVREGDEVHAGDPILALDPRRADARVEQAQAELRRAEAVLDELHRGTRIETIDAARANFAGASASAQNARKERDRLGEIRKRGLIAQAELDRAETSLRNAQAESSAARARLDELLHGTRIEDIEQAVQGVASATAVLDQRTLERVRYDVVAPRDGRVDALPFRLGDQPAAGAVLVSLLAGPSYARIYVPASQRARLQQGAHCRIHVTGIEGSFDADVRSLRSDPAFTPYYALTGDDASRLSFRAELVLSEERASSLPAGLPVQAECDGSQGDMTHGVEQGLRR